MSSVKTLEYTLLLPSRVDMDKIPFSCSLAPRSGSRSPADMSGSHVARKLVLDLLFSKVEDLTRVAETWSKRSGDGGSQISGDKLRSLIDVCLTGNLVMPMLSDLSSSMARSVESTIVSLLELSLRAATEASTKSELMQTILLGVGPLLPQISLASMQTLISSESRYLLGTMVMLSDAIRQTEGHGLSFEEEGVMNMDDEFDMGTARNGSTATLPGIPRRDNFLRLTQEAFLQDTTLRLHLIAAFNGEEGQVTLIPPSFIDELVGLAPASFLLCIGLMKELFQSDLIVSADDALAVVQTIGDFVAESEYQYCEALWCIAVDIMEGFVSLWTDETLKVSGLVGDLYVFLVKRSLPGEWLSPRCQAWFSGLLLKLLAVKPTYGTSLEQESCKTTLFAILKRSLLVVKYTIAMKLEGIFGFYVLKNHDDIFVDILDNLPADPDNAEGIAFRMFALTELACKWPTLLRRCVYHIFETPGRISQSAGFASGCLKRISTSLSLSSPQELFNLFSPQLLYTWLEEELIDDIPYAIFGYATLRDLLDQIKTEAVAIMVMRGQDEAAVDLAKKLGSSCELPEGRGLYGGT
jgi:serine-protein kinase ATM